MPSPHIQLGVLRPLIYVLGAASVAAILWWAQAVFMPIALAGLVGFILIAPVAALERTGLPRAAGIALVMAVVVGAVAGFGYVISRQFNDFASHLPQYSSSIRTKLAALREARKDTIGQIEETVEEVSSELEPQDTTAPPQRVTVIPTQPTDLDRLQMVLEPALRPIATAGLVLVLATFVLAQREDIRNRLIRLAGRGRVTITTRALDEAGQRISRYLFSQSVINAAFGVIIACGLSVIGVPYALLWGVSAALLRFIPYLGSLLAMLMPAALAFVSADGWGPTLQTLALFSSMDALTAYVVEPILIGTRAGISSLALLISAMFWTWLWGPVGLLLSTPLTVCLAAVGKYIPEVEFLAVLLGDDPPLEPELSFYQRLLAGDEDEAADIVEREIRQQPREQVFDHVVVPSLLLAERDRLADAISDVEHEFVTHTILEIVRNTPNSPGAEDITKHAEDPAQLKVLGIPARSVSDEVSLEMLGQVLGKQWAFAQTSTATLASEVLSAIAQRPPDVICIVAQPPGGLTHARYLGKRIHERFPTLPLCVLRAGAALTTREGVPFVSSFAEVTAHLARLVRSDAAATCNAASDATLARAGAEKLTGYVA